MPSGFSIPAIRYLPASAASASVCTPDRRPNCPVQSRYVGQWAVAQTHTQHPLKTGLIGQILDKTRLRGLNHCTFTPHRVVRPQALSADPLQESFE